MAQVAYPDAAESLDGVDHGAIVLLVLISEIPWGLSHAEAAEVKVRPYLYVLARAAGCFAEVCAGVDWCQLEWRNVQARVKWRPGHRRACCCGI